LEKNILGSDKEIGFESLTCDMCAMRINMSKGTISSLVWIGFQELLKEDLEAVYSMFRDFLGTLQSGVVV
jgi:hypothetical protein